ncbi:MAG: amidohydrolase family protein [Gemmatimonadaceae bacterium]
MDSPPFLLIEHGEIYAPEPRGTHSVLVSASKVVKVGRVDRKALDALGVDYDVIDATDCHVVPGFVDPHEHLLGGSGEGGLSLQTPMLFLTEIVRAGITTVVGTLGVDTTMKTISGLLGHVKGLSDEGITTCMWTGGYNVPPTTVLDSVRQDIMFIDEVVGTGEIAISDERSLSQSVEEIATVVRDTHVGGLLTGKAGVTHFHIGEEDTRLAPLRQLVEEYRIKPECLYPTHVQRNERLLDEAIDLAKRGAYVDFDVVEKDLAKWVRHYRDHGGPMDRLTVSSDSDSSTPDIFWDQLCGLVVKFGIPLEQMLPLVTQNTARVLKLRGKGAVAAGCDADLVVLQRGTLEIREVIARGRRMVADGAPCVRERFLEKSSRKYELVGDKLAE